MQETVIAWCGCQPGVFSGRLSLLFKKKNTVSIRAAVFQLLRIYLIFKFYFYSTYFFPLLLSQLYKEDNQQHCYHQYNCVFFYRWKDQYHLLLIVILYSTQKNKFVVFRIPSYTSAYVNVQVSRTFGSQLRHHQENTLLLMP